MSYKQKFPISTTDGGLGVTSTTDKSIIVTNGTSAVTFVTNTAAADPLLSVNGAAPAFSSPVPVIGGGTGKTSNTTAFAIVCGGTTTTGALQEVATVGSNTNVLVSNGAAALPTWQAMPAGGGPYYQKLISGTTYTPTTGMKYCIVEAYGAGGGGGGSIINAVNIGASGGAGGYCMKIFSAADIGASQTYAIGAAGAGVAGDNGTNGGDTTFGAWLTAGGGKGGKKGLQINTPISGGAGGSASGGDLNVPGANGLSPVAGAYGASRGATSYWGSGAVGVVCTNNTGAEKYNGNNAIGYASGGGGGYKDYSDATNTTGGNGTAGIIYIREYV